MKPEQPTTDSPESEGSLRARAAALMSAGRAWVAANRGTSLAIAGSSLLLLSLTLVGWFMLIGSPAAAEEIVTLEMALEAIDRRSLARAAEIAAKLQAENQVTSGERGTLAFVLGAITAYETDDNWEKDKSQSYLLAAKHLEDSRDRGFPSGRESEGLYLLGRCLYLSGQFAACRVVLQEALSVNSDRAAEIERMLAGAYLQDGNPKFAEALEYNTRYLAHRMLAKSDREEGQLQRAQILFRLGRWNECRQALDKIPATSPVSGEVVLTHGRLLLEQARQIKNDPQRMAQGTNLKDALPKYQEAVETFRQAQGRDTLGAQTTRKAMYLVGVCYAETGQYRAAQEQLERTRKLYYESPEGLAASLLSADMLRLLKEHEAAVSDYQRTFAAAGDPRTFSNPWITLDEFRLRMSEAFQAYAQAGEHEYALRLLRNFRPMFSQFRTVELTAQIQRAWADALQSKSQTLPEAQARAQQREAGLHYRRAGHTYARLAKLRAATRSFSDDLWLSGENLVLGHDYTNAIKILNEYLHNEQRRRRPQALVALGKAYLALGDAEESIRALNECIRDYSQDPAVYDARLGCSKALQELGRTEEAEALLLTNLTGDTLTPASREWRESLFALGNLLHHVGRDEEAIRYLEEAVARYPDSPQAIEATYTIAEAHRQAAKIPQEKLREATIESVRLDQSREIKRLLEAAQQNYLKVQKALNQKEEASDLTELEAAMLRNCYFFLGAALFDLGRYEEAIKAYSDASTRYQSDPIVLEAFLQIANCHRRLRHPVEARGALAQAKVVWKRLPENADFLQSTNYNREEWEKLLEQVSAW